MNIYYCELINTFIHYSEPTHTMYRVQQSGSFKEVQNDNQEAKLNKKESLQAMT